MQKNYALGRLKYTTAMLKHMPLLTAIFIGRRDSRAGLTVQLIFSLYKLTLARQIAENISERFGSSCVKIHCSGLVLTTRWSSLLKIFLGQRCKSGGKLLLTRDFLGSRYCGTRYGLACSHRIPLLALKPKWAEDTLMKIYEPFSAGL